ncbi:hypothetical protein C8J57DRAFT_1282373 [Mycena rebaudengoi]|nr:hypothetical protein C8J57DRAFT_1282373 [Mycena rebaudengoi]
MPVDMWRPYSFISLPYTPIYQWGYGRMDASTPTQGLVTSGVCSCTVVVLHSPTTGRTVLTHSPNFMWMNRSFLPIVDWITGGDGKTQWSAAERAACIIQAVVLRGYDYASARAARRPITVESCVDAPKLLTSGAVLVDKVSARITYLAPQRGNFLHRVCQQKQDLFVGNALNERIPVDMVDLHLQYAVSTYGPAIPLPDEVRQLLRRMPATPPEQSLLLRTLKDPDSQMVRDIFKSSLEAGHPCELCGEIGSSRCAACEGAWYCGRAHQKEDWKNHKTWCRLQPFREMRRRRGKKVLYGSEIPAYCAAVYGKHFAGAVGKIYDTWVVGQI